MGQNRKPFRMAKVRSMKIDAEANGAAFASADDSRITGVGSFLRRYRLDEIPQFWNVLRGEMSLIGPRPEQVSFSTEYEKLFPLYGLRYNLRPGITGWAQVMKGYAASASDNYGKLRYDLYYIRNVSPLLDLEIVLRTVRVVLSGFGAK
jgi:lipopolysaccharide/colanic/teichoic acid biosynthesis glycosyltransferase